MQISTEFSEDIDFLLRYFPLSFCINSTMLKTYWMLEIYGTVRPAQLECLILETRIATKSNRSFRLRIAQSIPWTDSP